MATSWQLLIVTQFDKIHRSLRPLTAALATLPTHQAGFSCGESIGSKGSPRGPLKASAGLPCGTWVWNWANSLSPMRIRMAKSAWIPIHLSPVILYHISYTLRNLETIDNHSIVWDLFIFPGPSHEGYWWQLRLAPILTCTTTWCDDLVLAGCLPTRGKNWVCLKTGVSHEKIANAMIKYDFMMINHRILPISNTPTSQRSKFVQV